MLCLALLGTIIGLFFRRLSSDLHTLQVRALDIVNGYRGEPIPVTRHDEVGQLIAAVNGMVDALDTREKELMVERQKYFHQEKMAAIGALAAGVAHEIGNPIAAISGVAQEIVARKKDAPDTCRNCRPELIYAQTQRLSAITREISDFASPQATEPQFLGIGDDTNPPMTPTRACDHRVRCRGIEAGLDARPSPRRLARGAGLPRARRALLKALEEAVILFEGERVVLVAGAVQNLFGWKPDELNGREADDLFPPNASLFRLLCARWRSGLTGP